MDLMGQNILFPPSVKGWEGGRSWINTSTPAVRRYLFGVAEHWNAEFLGWHVAKIGNRFEATQAVGMAVHQQFGEL